MPSKHAIFSPSSAERSIACPASCLLNYTMPESINGFAEEGTRAHAAAEAVLTGKTPVYDDPNMEEQVGKYVSFVMGLVEPGGILYTEKHVDIVPGCFGTIDALIVNEHDLHIVDLKYGRKPVEATGNKQLILYAFGALKEFPRKKVVLHIFQPNLGLVSTNSCTDVMIQDAVSTWRGAIDKAINGGNGEFHAGEHCTYCKAAPYCAERMKSMNAWHDNGMLDEKDLAELYPKLDPLIKWAETTKKQMIADAVEGRYFPGLDLVTVPGRSFISDPKLLEKHIQEKGLDVPVYERKVAAMTSLKKAIGEHWDEVSKDCVSRKPNTYKLEKEEF